VSTTNKVCFGHLRPIDDICAMSTFPPIAADLLYHGDGRKGSKGGVAAGTRDVFFTPMSGH
jgi:hypothetical protein